MLPTLYEQDDDDVRVVQYVQPSLIILDEEKAAIMSTDPSRVQYWTPVQVPPSPTSSFSVSSSPDSSPPPSVAPQLHPTSEKAAQLYDPPPPSYHQAPQPDQVLSQHQHLGELTRPPIPRKPTPLRVPTRKTFNGSFLSSGFVWIGLYFVFNMGLTLYNKIILVHFPFPYTITALHTLCGTIGCLWLKRIGYFTPARLTVRQSVVLALFSVLYTMNIAVSNISLQLVTVPFHQVVRASAPLFTILVGYLIGSSRGKGLLGVGHVKLCSLIPVVAGVGFATYGDYSFTAWGFILTLFGTFLAALKTVLTSVLQAPPTQSRNDESGGLPTSSPEVGPKHGYKPSQDYRNPPAGRSFHTLPSSIAKKLRLGRLLGKMGFITKRFDLDFGLQSQSMMSTSIKLHPLDLLLRMSPLAFIQCVGYSWASGEMHRAWVHKGPGATGWSRQSAMILLFNGVIAFLLNVVSLTANQKNGPLTMTVSANVKQVLTILLAVYMFGLSIAPANGIGIILTLAGGAWYGAIEYKEKQARINRR